VNRESEIVNRESEIVNRELGFQSKIQKP